MQTNKISQFSQTLKDKLIENDKNNYFTVFYSPECYFSQKALDLLRKNRVGFKGYVIEQNKQLYLNALRLIKFDEDSNKRLAGHDTKPIVFYKMYFIGGFSELDIYFLKKINTKP